MRQARRIYLYLVSAVSLAVLGVALADLLALAFGLLTAGNGALLQGGDAGVRRVVSADVALTLTALPIWLLHWWLTERGATRADEDRRAALRAFYFAAVAFVSFTIVFGAARGLLERLSLAAVAPDVVRPGRTASAALAILLVAGAVWVVHVAARRRDERAGALIGDASWWPRLARLAISGVGLAYVTLGASRLLDVTVGALAARAGRLLAGGDWLAPPLAATIAATLVGLLAWGGAWGATARLLDDPGWRSASERESRLRQTYLALACLAGVLLTLIAASGVLDAVLRVAFGDVVGQPRRALVWALRLLPFGVLWGYHRALLLRESAAMEPEPRRVYRYGAAFIGLAFAGVGVARLLGLAGEALTDGAGGTLIAGGAWWERDTARYAALALVGAGAWLWQWRGARRMVEADPAETGSRSRRLYLALSLAAAVIALLGGVAVVVYRLLAAALDVAQAGGLGRDVSGPLGVAIVAAAVAGWHGVVLRREFDDRRERVATPEDEPTLPLTLVGPPGSDLAGTLAALRIALPPGHELRPRDPAARD